MSFAITPKELKARLDKGDKLGASGCAGALGKPTRQAGQFHPHSARHAAHLPFPIGQKRRDHRLLPSWDAKWGCDGVFVTAGVFKREEPDRRDRCLV